MDSAQKPGQPAAPTPPAPGDGPKPLDAASPDLQVIRPAPARPAHHAPLWMRRLSLFIFVAFAVELGMLLVVLPWTRVWSENTLLQAYPGVRAVLQADFIRGVISGVGLLDIWLGISAAVHYKETIHGREVS